MSSQLNVADPAVLAYRDAPERLVAFARGGPLSKFTLASVLEPHSRQQFLDTCAALEQHFTERCAAKGDFCLEDGCAMDGESCLQALTREGSGFQQAMAAEWIRLFQIKENRIEGWRS
jgi:hypothetical protein